MSVNLHILFASATGTAQDLAESVWRVAWRRGLRPSVACCSIASVDSIVDMLCEAEGETMMLFVVATCGEGDAPQSMHTLWDSLCQRALPPTLLASNVCQFAVIGLGDSQYDKFNFAAKRLNRRLRQLGARMALDVGLADEQHDLGIDGLADVWLEEMWSKIGAAQPTDDASFELPPKYTIDYLDADSSHAQATTSHTVPVLRNTRITPATHWQDTRLIEVDIDGTRSGDVAVVQPRNLDESVRSFLDTIDMGEEELNRKFSLRAGASNTLPPVNVIDAKCTTFAECASSYFDLQSVPRRSLLQQLAAFADDEMEREKLVEMTTARNHEDLFDYVNRPRRTTVEVLADFHKTVKRVPIHRWFDLLPCITPRQFSIASCQRKHGNVLQLLVAVVNFKSRTMKSSRLGLCSNWLARTEIGDRIAVRLQSGTLHLPTTGLPPAILIGPGTGVAPLRSYAWQRQMTEEKGEKGRTLLFFGGRNVKADFYFDADYEQLSALNARFSIVTAFSRDTDKTVYVQHRIAERSTAVADMLRDPTSIVVVCGASGEMPKAVRRALIGCLQRGGPMSEEEAEAAIQIMVTDGRYQLETWS